MHNQKTNKHKQIIKDNVWERVTPHEVHPKERVKAFQAAYVTNLKIEGNEFLSSPEASIIECWALTSLYVSRNRFNRVSSFKKK